MSADRPGFKLTRWHPAPGLLVALLAVVAPPVVSAESPPPIRWDLFPTGRLVEGFAADPYAHTFGMSYMTVRDVGVVDSGEPRVWLQLGGRFGILRWRPPKGPLDAVQLSFAAGFSGQFDVEHSLDNIGWDGRYGLVLSARAGESLALELGALHTSSHVGDELLERVGRGRIGYTREEAAATAVWFPGRRWRVLLEAAHGFDLRHEELMAPGRVRTALEHHRREVLWSGRGGWYAAADLSAWEEREWQLDVAAQVGLSFPSGDRTWRLGLGWIDGRVPIGEFFEDDEEAVVIGVWLDL